MDKINLVVMGQGNLDFLACSITLQNFAVNDSTANKSGIGIVGCKGVRHIVHTKLQCPYVKACRP